MVSHPWREERTRRRARFLAGESRLSDPRRPEPPLIGAGVALLIDLEELTDVQMRVLLGGGQAFMPEKLLDDAEVGPAAQEMGGEGMAKGVRRDVAADGRPP